MQIEGSNGNCLPQDDTCLLKIPEVLDKPTPKTRNNIVDMYKIGETLKISSTIALDRLLYTLGICKC